MLIFSLNKLPKNNPKLVGDSSPTNFTDEDRCFENDRRKPLRPFSSDYKEPSSKLVGDKGESIACEYLVKKEYEILGRNYRIKFGEIDIIARKKSKLFRSLLFGGDKTIHFIEVKTIIGNEKNFFPEEKVDRRKRQKLRRLAEIWLDKNKFPQDQPCQIDVIGVIMDDIGEEPEIRHFENVVENYY